MEKIRQPTKEERRETSRGQNPGSKARKENDKERQEHSSKSGFKIKGVWVLSYSCLPAGPHLALQCRLVWGQRPGADDREDQEKRPQATRLVHWGCEGVGGRWGRLHTLLYTWQVSATVRRPVWLRLPPWCTCGRCLYPRLDLFWHLPLHSHSFHRRYRPHDRFHKAVSLGLCSLSRCNVITRLANDHGPVIGHVTVDRPTWAADDLEDIVVHRQVGL